MVCYGSARLWLCYELSYGDMASIYKAMARLISLFIPLLFPRLSALSSKCFEMETSYLGCDQTRPGNFLLLMTLDQGNSTLIHENACLHKKGERHNR